MKTVFNLRDSVGAILSGVDLNNVDNLNGAFERAARVFVQKAKIPETTGTQNKIIYSGVTDYTIDSRIYGTSIIDIRPQGITRQANDFVYKRMSSDFDRTKKYVYNGTICTFDYQTGTPIIRIVSTYSSPLLILDAMNDITGWTAGGDASGLAIDNTFYYQVPGSLRFNLNASGSNGYLEKTINQANLTSYLGVGVIFLAVELPNASDITSIGLRIGSDSSNYYNISNIVSTLGAFVSGQFMLVPFDLSLATTVGSPNIANITYLRPYINYNGTLQSNVRFGDLFISLPTPVQILYSSAGFFKVGDIVSTSITTNNDEIILNDSAYTIYEHECAISVLQQTGGGTADSTMQELKRILNGVPGTQDYGLYNLYRGENPSEVLRTAGEWYDNESGYNDRL